MAITITRLFHHLALFLLLVQFADAVLVPNTKNHASLKLQSSSTATYIVHVHHLAKPPHFATLDHWYTSMVASHSPRAAMADDSTRLLYTYDTVMHGFAVELTADEARRMASAAGVNAVHEDRQLRLLTTRTPGFLGLDPEFGAWRDTDLGDGVIIGFVDTGIWPESPSFNDNGLGPVRPSWRGKCVGAGNFNASLCNNKLVGAKSFGPNSPRDTTGHGSHVASIAAGSEVRDAGFDMFARGTARGVAPKARIAMYAVAGVTMAGTAAAVDAAVKDGVDILSLSIGDAEAQPYYNDTFAIALFGAERNGVSVVLAGGNDGPEASTVVNSAPWMTTVGASTVDRLFPAKLILGGGDVVTGQSLYRVKSNSTTMTPLLASSCLEQDLTPEKIKGSIVVCMGGPFPSGNQIRNAGGAGVVVVDTTGWWQATALITEAAEVPLLVLAFTAGEKVRNYVASSRRPVGSLSFAPDTVIGENRAPMVTGFSSRGPNPVAVELLKPDVVAPGQEVLGAWKGDYSYRLESGTSMACPHVAGVAALIKKKHPSWTPAMVRSALITTAGNLDNQDREILDNGVTHNSGSGNVGVATPFATGAGHVRPQLAMDPGLVYDADEGDYLDFLCALNYTAEQLRLFVPEFVSCTRALAGGPAGLNYPSFVVVFDNRTDARTLTRTLTNVFEEAESYSVSIVVPEHVMVIVTPTTLEFKKPKERKSYTVEFRNEAGGGGKTGWDFGEIIWQNINHRVRSPMAFQWNN